MKSLFLGLPEARASVATTHVPCLSSRTTRSSPRAHSLAHRPPSPRFHASLPPRRLRRPRPRRAGALRRRRPFRSHVLREIPEVRRTCGRPHHHGGTAPSRRVGQAPAAGRPRRGSAGVRAGSPRAGAGRGRRRGGLPHGPRHRARSARAVPTRRDPGEAASRLGSLGRPEQNRHVFAPTNDAVESLLAWGFR